MYNAKALNTEPAYITYHPAQRTAKDSLAILATSSRVISITHLQTKSNTFCHKSQKLTKNLQHEQTCYKQTWLSRFTKAQHDQLTTVINQQQFDEIIIICPSSELGKITKSHHSSLKHHHLLRGFIWFFETYALRRCYWSFWHSGGFAFERTFECSVNERDKVFVLCISFTGVMAQFGYPLLDPN